MTRDIQPVDVENPLALDAEPLARRGQHRHAGRLRHDLGEKRRAFDEVLEVVENQERRPPVQEVQKLLPGREATELHVDPELERCCHRRGQEVGRGHRGERDEVDPVLIAIEPARSRLQGEARLAGASGADEGEEAAGRVVEAPFDRGQLLRPADEGGPRGGEVGAAGLERPQRREIGRQALDLELEDPLGGAEVLEPVRPEVAGAHLNERPRGLRQEDLAPVADGGDARRPVDVDADVAVRGRSRLAGVEPHPDPDGAAGQRPLGIHRRSDGL